ncbi:MAG: AbrB/MazE/SpoVT family DNA-binding domain-containing protein [Candidatus Caldarchaeum sp.]|nr:AbrB/MazE/SpoVT family DNA-binding domain-containing protein [Candidatus Caldarchaeum sp.]
MEIRRAIQLTGGSSYVVTLPKEWVERMGLSKGSTVLLKPTEDGGIVVYPEKVVEKQLSEVEIPLTPDVNQLIVGAYLYGYSLIKIVSKTPISDTQFAEIRKSVRGLAGAEIVDETSEKIEIQVVIDREVVAPEKLLRRQHNLVLGMTENAVEAVVKRNASLARIVVQRDEEVDRLYFTLVRILRSAVLDPALAKKMDVSPLTLLDFRVAAKFIEDAGDQAAEIGKETLRNIKAPGEDFLTEFKNLANLVVSMGSGPLEALFSKDLNKINQVTNVRKEFLRRSEHFLKKISGRENSASLYKLYFHLARICEDFADIAELSIPFKTGNVPQT